MKDRRNSMKVAWWALGIGLVAAVWLWPERPRRRRVPVRDYSDRSGLPRPADAMRGAARTDFAMPADMATPAPLKPLVMP
jgi:hypothetical protein